MSTQLKIILFGLYAIFFTFLSSCAPSTPQSRIAANPELYAALTPTQQKLVQEGKLAPGMPETAVFLAWGRPSQNYEGFDGSQPTRYWEYYGSRPVFYNGFYRYPYPGYYDPYSYYYSYRPMTEYIPYRRASVMFKNQKVARWEELKK